MKFSPHRLVAPLIDSDDDDEDEDGGFVKKAKTSSSNRQLSAAVKVMMNNWLFAYRKRWGSQYFRMLPEATIYAISDSVPLTLEVGRWVGG